MLSRAWRNPWRRAPRMKRPPRPDRAGYRAVRCRRTDQRRTAQLAPVDARDRPPRPSSASAQRKSRTCWSARVLRAFGNLGRRVEASHAQLQRLPSDSQASPGRVPARRVANRPITVRLRRKPRRRVVEGRAFTGFTVTVRSPPMVAELAIARPRPVPPHFWVAASACEG